MNQPYQTERSEAVDQFREWAQASGQAVQFTFPTPDMVQLAEQGLGELLRKVGKLFIESVMEAEAEQIVGPRSKPDPKRQAYRWGSEEGYCVIDGQKVPVARPRLRNKAQDREIPLGSYELFQRASLIQESVWHKIMHGLTMRSYKEVIQQFSDAYGLNKSTVSEHFIEASRKKLEQLLTRSLEHLSICVMMIDGTIFKGANLVVAIGVDRFGHKVVLGLRQGATENATVVGELLEDLEERGLDFRCPRLYVVDGGKGIRRAILNRAGEAAFLQRCQVHKIRNVCEYLPEAQRHAVRFQMRAAYGQDEASDARLALYRLHDHLMLENPSAAASLAEGLEETLTVNELRVPAKLRPTLSNTNGIESSFSVVDKICRQVKRWRGSDHRMRWVGSAIAFVETRWSRVHGYNKIQALVDAMNAAYELRIKSQRAGQQRKAGAA